MYRLPTDLDVRKLTGRVLSAVTFTANTIHLVFEPDFTLTLEGAFSFAPADSPLLRLSVPVSTSGLMTLIGQEVVAAAGDAVGTLSLTFSSGARLECYDDPHYESYRMVIDGAEIVV